MLQIDEPPVENFWLRHRLILEQSSECHCYCHTTSHFAILVLFCKHVRLSHVLTYLLTSVGYKLQRRGVLLPSECKHYDLGGRAHTSVHTVQTVGKAARGLFANDRSVRRTRMDKQCCRVAKKALRSVFIIRCLQRVYSIARLLLGRRCMETLCSAIAEMATQCCPGRIFAVELEYLSLAYRFQVISEDIAINRILPKRIFLWYIASADDRSDFNYFNVIGPLKATE